MYHFAEKLSPLYDNDIGIAIGAVFCLAFSAVFMAAIAEPAFEPEGKLHIAFLFQQGSGVDVPGFSASRAGYRDEVVVVEVYCMHSLNCLLVIL